MQQIASEFKSAEVTTATLSALMLLTRQQRRQMERAERKARLVA